MTTHQYPPGHETRWCRPTYTNASLADPLPYPRPVLLRSSCGRVIGAAIVGRCQRVIQWKRCR